jgi:hypothetical protein
MDEALLPLTRRSGGRDFHEEPNDPEKRRVNPPWRLKRRAIFNNGLPQLVMAKKDNLARM